MVPSWWRFEKQGLETSGADYWLSMLKQAASRKRRGWARQQTHVWPWNPCSDFKAKGSAMKTQHMQQTDLWSFSKPNSLEGVERARTQELNANSSHMFYVHVKAERNCQKYYWINPACYWVYRGCSACNRITFRILKSSCAWILSCIWYLSWS